jgi:hypothetical protein
MSNLLPRRRSIEESHEDRRSRTARNQHFLHAVAAHNARASKVRPSHDSIPHSICRHPKFRARLRDRIAVLLDI